MPVRNAMPRHHQATCKNIKLLCLDLLDPTNISCAQTNSAAAPGVLLQVASTGSFSYQLVTGSSATRSTATHMLMVHSRRGCCALTRKGQRLLAFTGGGCHVLVVGLGGEGQARHKGAQQAQARGEDQAHAATLKRPRESCTANSVPWEAG